jgi:hypothetical protein
MFPDRYKLVRPCIATGSNSVDVVRVRAARKKATALQPLEERRKPANAANVSSNSDPPIEIAKYCQVKYCLGILRELTTSHHGPRTSLAHCLRNHFEPADL